MLRSACSLFCVLLAVTLPAGAATKKSPRKAGPLPALTQPISQAQRYLAQGNAYLQHNQFPEAIDNYTRAIKLNDALDDAYFGRGMARGRAGEIDAGIADISVYIARNPDNSRAYTKRGIRYVWKGDSDNAQRDFLKAVALDPNNAEAYDDLGVIYAQRREYPQAMESFRKVVSIEPAYFKAYHNLALVHFILGDYATALNEVNKVFPLKPDSRNSMMLKSLILKNLGRDKEARAVEEEAEFLPEENWTERAPVQ